MRPQHFHDVFWLSPHPQQPPKWPPMVLLHARTTVKLIIRCSLSLSASFPSSFFLSSSFLLISWPMLGLRDQLCKQGCILWPGQQDPRVWSKNSAHWCLPYWVQTHRPTWPSLSEQEKTGLWMHKMLNKWPLVYIMGFLRSANRQSKPPTKLKTAIKWKQTWWIILHVGLNLEKQYRKLNGVLTVLHPTDTDTSRSIHGVCSSWEVVCGLRGDLAPSRPAMWRATWGWILQTGHRASLHPQSVYFRLS